MSIKPSAAVRRLSRKIAASESADIEERWKHGLAILADPNLMSDSGESLRHGALETLIAEAGVTSDGRSRLSEREIQRRIQCARTYCCPSQIRHAVADFPTWRALAEARFPRYDPDPGEEPADPRSPEELRRDLERQFSAVMSEELSLFPLDEYLPERVTVGQLEDYAAETQRMSAGFAAAAARRVAYVERLKTAVGGDVGRTWLEADQALQRIRRGGS